MADYSTSIVNAAVDQVGDLVQSGLTRWTNASAAIEAGTYTADNLVSDSLFLWSAGITKWCTFPFKVLLRHRPLVLFTIAPGTTGDVEAETDILAPNAGAPASSDLLRIGGAQTIPSGQVVATLNAQRTKLKIRLTGLTAAMTTAGFIYSGDISIGGEQLSVVRVVVA